VPCLEALRREGGDELEILVVSQGAELGDGAVALADRVLRLERNVGFARANNLALAEARGELVAMVNDDAVVDEGWLPALLAALDGEPRAAAAQGVHLRLGDPGRLDGCGLAWNRWWQAVQLHRGEAAAALATALAGAGPREVFGVSATAAIYRRAALEAAAEPDVFDPRLVSYYEDVDLAVRLRAAGFGAVLAPAAVARHAGSFTGGNLGSARWRLLYGNRHLVLARLFGGAFWRHWPRILLRDAADFARAVLRADVRRGLGIVAGLGRALLRLPGFVRSGAPLVAIEELRRFQVDR
jgi:GT2 family glycosyltransferase